jgi:hypothetical protein
MADAFRCLTFQKLVEFPWNIVPRTTGERAVHLVQYRDVAYWVRHEGEELNRVVRPVQTAFSGEVQEELYIVDNTFLLMLRFVCCGNTSVSGGDDWIEMRVHGSWDRTYHAACRYGGTSRRRVRSTPPLLPHPFLVHLVSHEPSHEGDPSYILLHDTMYNNK